MPSVLRVHCCHVYFSGSPLYITPTVSLASRAKEGTYFEGCLPGASAVSQFASHISLQVVSEGVPLVLTLVPHRQPHSFMSQSSSDMLVSTPGKFPIASSLCLRPRLCNFLPTGDCECQWATRHS